jgi:hypothetical protein
MSRPILPGLVLVLFCLACLPLSLSVKTGNFAEDERTYYLPSVALISPHWPRLDLANDATSAASPGYAYVLAGVSRLTGQDTRVFRLITIATSAAALGLLFLMFEAPRGWAACAAILPLAASNFFIKSSAWVVTDNAALFWSCAALLALWKSPHSPGWPLPAGLSATAAILTRQLHAWLVVPIAFAALAGPHPGGPGPRAPARLLACLALVPPLAALLWMHHAWGGFVPPAWRETHSAGIHPASVACALSVLGAFGIFYVLSVEAPSGVLGLARSVEAACGAAAGFAVSIVAPNGMDREAGRWGGYFWMIVGHAPALWGRSVVVMAGSTCGGALLGAMVRRLNRSSGSSVTALWLAAVVSWLAACALNQLAVQRYFEPPILVFLISWVAFLTQTRGRADGTPIRCAPLVLLALAQGTLSLVTIFIPVLSA